MRRERILNITKKLIGEFGTRDPIEIAGCLGIRIREKPLPDGVVGLVAEVFGINYILLHFDLPVPDKHYIVAHEIFHYLDRHPDYIFLRWWRMKTGYEAESDLFAASLLVSEEPEWGETIEQYACRTGVSMKLVRLWFRKVV